MSLPWLLRQGNRAKTLVALGENARSILIRLFRKWNSALPHGASRIPAMSGPGCLLHPAGDKPDRTQAGRVDCPRPGIPPLYPPPVLDGAAKSCGFARFAKTAKAMRRRLRPFTGGPLWPGSLHVTSSPGRWPGTPSHRSLCLNIKVVTH